MYIVPNYLGKYNDRRPYTYMWLREDGRPYYVGKGMGERAFKKRRLGNAPPRDRIILQEFETNEDALQAEIFLIAYYGREDKGEGCLLNLTDGGDMPPNAKGLKRRPESIKKFVEARRGKGGFKMSPETKAKIIAANRGRIPWNKGKEWPEEVKERLRAYGKEFGFQPGYTPWNRGKRPEQLGRVGRWKAEGSTLTK